jgi:hypothetical protein
MPLTEPGVQVARVAALERELQAARSLAAKSIRSYRKSKRIPLHEAAKGARLSPSALSKLECAGSWQTQTAARVVRYLQRAS